MKVESSDWYDVVSGVPQSCVLGPLLLFFMSTIFLTISTVAASQIFANNLKVRMVMNLGPNTKHLYSVGNSEHLSPVDEPEIRHLGGLNYEILYKMF